MKAFLLAAGLGTRLRPITNNIPKCLVEINGKPILGWWLDHMHRHRVTEVLINLHYFPEKVKEFLINYNSEVKVKFTLEEKLRGSAGTLKNNKSFVENEDEFFVIYADNLTNCNLTSFLKFHRDKKNDFSMALFRASNPSACGIVDINENSVITDFEEKPENPKSNLANAGIYIASPSVIDLIPEQNLADIGFHLLPLLVNKMSGWVCEDYLLDIGTIENLKKAKIEWPKIIEGK